MKKKNLSWMAFLSLAMMACTGQPVTNGYVLKGSVEGLPDGTHVQLVPVSHDNEAPMADTTVTNGQFIFQGKVEEPRAVRLIVKDAYGWRSLILENTPIEISGAVTERETNGNLSYNLSDLF